MFGDKVFVVEDRMNKRYWHRVDVWMPTRQEAIILRIRTLKMRNFQSQCPLYKEHKAWYADKGITAY